MNKTRLLLYLTIGNLFAALLWNFPVKAWNLEDLSGGVRDSINALAAGSSQQTEPLPVPQAQPPNAQRHEVPGNPGNAATIQPCAALPPPLAAAPRPKAKPKTIAIVQPVQPVQTIQPAPYMAPSSERVYYNQGGAITQAKADRMSHYSKPQSRKAILSILGAPKWFDSGSDVYEIEGSSDGISAGRRFVVTYELDPESQFTIAHATNWIQQ